MNTKQTNSAVINALLLQIKERMHVQNIKPKELENILHMSQGGISHYLTGKRKIPIDKLFKLLDFLNLQISSYELKEIRKDLGRLTPNSDKFKQSDILTDLNATSLSEAGMTAVRLPLLTWERLAQSPQPLGQIIDNLEEEDYMVVEIQKEKLAPYIGHKLFIIEIPEGDAMVSAEPNRKNLFSGERVIVNADIKPKNKQLVLAKHDEAYIIRQYVEDGTSKILKPYNKQFLVINFNQTEILGVIIRKTGEDLE